MKSTWKISKYFIFRCAGFPFELIEKVKFKNTCQAIDKLLAKSKVGSYCQSAKEIFEEELYNKRLQLQEVASTPRFLEAVFHQNQNNYYNGAYEHILSFSKQSIVKKLRNYNSRRKELLAYRYLQRFCTKNETVSFFGPFYIGKFDSVKENMVFRKSGRNRIKNRKTYISTKLLEAILDKIIHDDEVFKLLKPRRVPIMQVNGNQALDLITGSRIELDVLSLKILGLIDQGCSVKEVSLKLKNDQINKVDIFNKLRWLIKERVLLSGLELTDSVEDPSGCLINKLSRIPSAINNEWYVKLKKLIRTRREFEKGSFEIRKRVVSELRDLFLPLYDNQRFKDLKSEKGFFTEYCESDMELKLGKGMQRDLGKNLNFILNLASSNQANIKKINRALLRNWLEKNFKNREINIKDIMNKFAENSNGGNNPFEIGNRNLLDMVIDDLPVDFLELINKHNKNSLAKFNRSTLENKFSEYLDKTDEPAATCCDILISSSGKRAVNEKEYKIILGESHEMRKPLSIYKWIGETPSGGAKLIKDIKGIHKEIGKRYALSEFLTIPRGVLSRSCDFSTISQIEYDIYSERKENKIDPSDLRLCWDDNSVSFMETKKNKPILLLGSPSPLYRLFSILCPKISSKRFSKIKTHFPRVEIDKFVAKRESWVFVKDELFFAQESYNKKDIELWLDLEKWRRKENIPKQFFLNSENNLKPVFIDFENYFAIETFINYSKKARDKLLLTEMLPGPENLWLSDDAGRYTSEFRLILYKQ